MASDLKWEQKPVDSSDKVPVITNWNPAIGYMLYQDDATTASYYYYKLVLEVRLDDASGTILAKIKQRRNGYSVDVNANKARAFFDLRDIINSQLVSTVFDQNQTGIPFQTIHKLGANTGVTAKVYSVNGDNTTDGTQIEKIYVKGYQQYSTIQSAVPGEVTTDTVNDTRYYMAASLPLMTARDTDADYIQGTAFQPFQASAATDRFLSDVESSSGLYGLSGYINYVQWNDATDVGDYHTVAFLNDFANFASHIDKIQIKYYDSSGSALSTTSVTNNSTNGGLEPSGAVVDKHRILYYGCGPGNLEGQTVTGDSGAKPSDAANDGWAYYTVIGFNSTGSLQSTAPYYFIKQDGNCKGFKIRRLAWRNSLGCYDYFNFTMKSTQTVEVSRDNYNTMLGTYNKSKWRYNNTQRGKKTRQTTAILKETLNTDWITEEDANLLEKLIMSTDVYIVENADTTYTEGVMITDTSFVKKTSASDKLIQYTINIEYANPINTNS